jgi:hypothetical protein
MSSSILTSFLVIAADGLYKREVFRTSERPRILGLVSDNLYRLSRSLRRGDYRWCADKDDIRYQEDFESILE